MKIFKDIESHQVCITIEDGKVEDITCDCHWSSLHPDAWNEGKSLCKHIKQAIKELKNKNI